MLLGFNYKNAKYHMENYGEWKQIERRKIDYILTLAGKKDVNNTTNKHEANYKFIMNLYSNEFETCITKDNELFRWEK